MKKILLSLLLAIFLSQACVSQVFAQASPSPSPSASPRTLTADDPGAIAIGINWQPDAEVTFTGKLAVRSEEVLDWLLQNYQWARFSGSETPFDKLWESIRNTVFAILGLFILVGAFLMIITRGRSLTVKRLILRFLMVLILVIFSFSIVRTIYALNDIFQGFFLNVPKEGGGTRIISTEDLLNVAFEYKPFIGFRRIGPEYNESAITSLLLIKVTAATYYTMFIILILRKIVLWFFILVSPVFPLLLFFRPVRNTAKIWIGEFFRWVLYAPLFAIFLRGLVEIWKFGAGGDINKTGVPLFFDTSKAGTVLQTPDGGLIYPTAINILLGGPGQTVLGNNNINYSDTFVLYVVALLMLWMVIILPWILLRIFLDYFNSNSFGESNLVKFLARNGLPPPGRYRPESLYPSPGSPTPPQTPPPGVTGFARSLPLSKFSHTPVAEIQQAMQEEAAKAQEEIGQTAVESGRINAYNAQNATIQANQSATEGRITTLNAQNATIQANQLLASNLINISSTQSQQIIEALSQAGLSIPTMQDIARIEASSMQKSGLGKEEYNRLAEVLSRVAGTSQLVSPIEKQKFSQIKERLIVQSKQGNALAKSVVSAASPTVAGASLPKRNNVQQVNLEDYEEVKQTWEDNYRKLEPPAGADGKPKSRVDWLKEEIQQIPTVIDLLMSGDPARLEEGKKMVSKILPFLLLGGFSDTEIVAYLKAKLEAAKAVLKEVLQVEGQQEDTKIEVDRSKPAEKSMAAQAEAPLPEDARFGLSPAQASSADDSGINQTNISNQAQNEILQLTKLTIPTIKKIAEIETTILSGEGPAKEDISALNELIKGLSVETPSDPATKNSLILVKEKLGTAANRGDAVAKSIQAAMMPMNQVKLPESNQVQQVNLEDYEEVKQTWEDNYRKLEPPIGADGKPKSRVDWLKEEIKQIPTAIDLLMSGDPLRQEEGKKMVSKILPFLLLGGFSNTEIMSYLKAKLEAAKVVLKEVLQVEGQSEEEETKVEVDRASHEEKTMAAQAEAPIPTSSLQSGSFDSPDSSGEDESSPIAGALTSSPSGLSGAGSTINSANQINNSTQAQNEILQLTKLTIPTIKKIAEIETTILSGEGPAKEDISALNELIKGLSVETPSDPATKNSLILVKEKLGTAANRGDAVAKSIQAAMMPMNQVKLPESNQVQQVNLEDYEEVRKTWVENYKKLEVPVGPSGNPRSREGWLKEEIAQIPKVIDLLLSGDPAKVDEGKKMVSKILPFLLLGGFSKAEIMSYLKAKLEAAKQVLKEILQVEGEREEEEIKVEVASKPQEAKTMVAQEELPEEVVK